MICDQSCLNMIAIESRMQGDQEECKILLQRHLISSCFNERLSLRKRRTSIYKNLDAKNPRRPIRSRGFGRLQLREIGGPQSHDTGFTLP